MRLVYMANNVIEFLVSRPRRPQVIQSKERTAKSAEAIIKCHSVIRACISMYLGLRRVVGFLRLIIVAVTRGQILTILNVVLSMILDQILGCKAEEIHPNWCMYLSTTLDWGYFVLFRRARQDSDFGSHFNIANCHRYE